MEVNPESRVLIASLGGKAQVVTFALDHLLALRAPITQVYAVHLSTRDERVRRALSQVDAEISTCYAGRDIRFQSRPIRALRPRMGVVGTAVEGRPIEAVDDPEAATAIWMTFHRLIGTLKVNGAHIDLCLAGGPRLISLQALSVATLLFTSQDRCWHLYTPSDLRDQAGEGAIMHLPVTSGMRLVPVPLIPMGTLFPHLQTAAYMSPEEIIAERTEQLSEFDRQRCRSVYRLLTSHQRGVLRAFAEAETGDGVLDIAKRLGVVVSTVNTHKTVILDHCRNEWGLSQETRLTHHFLRDKFGRLPLLFWDE